VRAALIIGLPIVQSKNGRERLRRRMGAAEVLLLDAVPGSLVVVAAPITLAGPINRLMHVPKPRRMDTIRSGEGRKSCCHNEKRADATPWEFELLKTHQKDSKHSTRGLSTHHRTNMRW